MDKTQASGMETSYVASKVLKAVCRNENDVILASAFYRIVLYLKNIFPNIFASFMAKRALKEQHKQGWFFNLWNDLKNLSDFYYFDEFEIESRLV